MQTRISRMMSKPDFQAEFLANLFASTGDPSLISFSGGMPAPDAFPIPEMERAAQKVLEQDGAMALQYYSAQGYLPLREFICRRYREVMGVEFSPADIIITNGSQQALDMFSAVMLDPGDAVAVENPSYLAALQTFHLYDPLVCPIDLNEDGLDCEQLEKTLRKHDPKFIYVIPNFQNPTGLTYSEEVRVRAAEILSRYDCMVLEDNPYGELRFAGTAGHSLACFLGEQCCMLGTFSKIVSPGMRIGWIACKQPEIFEKLLSYKTTMDLHTNIFGQMVLARYLEDNDIEAHIEETRLLYRHKAEVMMACMEKYLPAGVTFTHPQGGMFIWATMPEGVRALDVQNEAMKRGVTVCAGDPFYEYERGVRTMRLNYSNSSDEAIDRGIRILADTVRDLVKAE